MQTKKQKLQPLFKRSLANMNSIEPIYRHNSSICSQTEHYKQIVSKVAFQPEIPTLHFTAILLTLFLEEYTHKLGVSPPHWLNTCIFKTSTYASNFKTLSYLIVLQRTLNPAYVRITWHKARHSLHHIQRDLTLNSWTLPGVSTRENKHEWFAAI